MNDDGTIAGIVAPMDILRGIALGLDVRDASQADSAIEYVDLRDLV